MAFRSFRGIISQWPPLSPRGFTSLVPFDMALAWPGSSPPHDDVATGCREFLPAFCLSTFLHWSKNFPETQGPGVPFLIGIHGGDLSTLKYLKTKIYPQLTRSLDLMRKWVPHLTHDRSHIAMWNHPDMPHHHGMCGLSQLELVTTTRKI